MAKIDDWYNEALLAVLNEGDSRTTRSGEVISLFDGPALVKHHLGNDGFPLLTSKSVPLRLVVGELLWFLSGKTDLKSLRHYSNIPEGGHTIWTDDFNRWWNFRDKNLTFLKGSNTSIRENEKGGAIYGEQWRNFAPDSEWGDGTDQILGLIDLIKNNPTSRHQIVTAYNPNLSDDWNSALPPCHTFFQTYVDNNDCLNLKWYQRSADMFLGLPFNIASYALLLKILARLTNKYEGTLSGTFGDMHIYMNHMEAVETVLGNPCFEAPKVKLPNFNTLEELLALTAEDFIIEEYNNAGVVKAPLSVG